MTRLVPVPTSIAAPRGYETLLRGVSALLEEARRSAARSVNTIITATYWEIGRRVVEYEQRGVQRAAYGEALLKWLSSDLTKRFGRGFSERNLEQMRLFYLGWPISQTLSAKFRSDPARRFPLAWSHYVRLLSVEDPQARTERGLWNGGQILGYDLDLQRKGHLIPNQKEAELVNRIFDTYLACGSVLETAKRINPQGYRTRAYTGRRGVSHLEEPFCYSATQQILTNHAYIGRKEINKKIRHQPQEKLPKAEVERSILELVRYFVSKSPLLAKVVARLNVRLQQRLPTLSAQRRSYQGELEDVNRKAGGCWISTPARPTAGGVFLEETLDQLAARRRFVMMIA